MEETENPEQTEGTDNTEDETACHKENTQRHLRLMQEILRINAKIAAGSEKDKKEDPMVETENKTDQEK
jgi:hypothetical protein